MTDSSVILTGEDGMARVSADRREEYLEERRERLLDAALAVFSRDGFDRATMATIAEQAGMAKGTIYNYFETKEELLSALLRERTHKIEQILKDESVPPRVALTAIARAFLEEALDRQPELARLVLVESPRFPHLAREMLRRLLQAGNRTVARYLERQAELGRIRPLPRPEASSMVFFGMLAAYVLGRDILAGGEMLPASRDEYCEHVVDLFLNGIYPRKEA